MNSISYLIFSFLFIASCGDNTANLNLNRISKIEFSSSTCYGVCPEFYLIIESSSLHYYGGEYAARRGYYEGSVTAGYWDTVSTRFSEYKLDDLRDTLQIDDDAAIKDVYFHYSDGHTKHLYGSEFPIQLYKELNWLYASSQRFGTKVCCPVKNRFEELPKR